MVAASPSSLPKSGSWPNAAPLRPKRSPRFWPTSNGKRSRQPMRSERPRTRWIRESRSRSALHARWKASRHDEQRSRIAGRPGTRNARRLHARNRKHGQRLCGGGRPSAAATEMRSTTDGVTNAMVPVAATASQNAATAQEDALPTLQLALGIAEIDSTARALCDQAEQLEAPGRRRAAYAAPEITLRAWSA